MGPRLPPGPCSPVVPDGMEDKADRAALQSVGAAIDVNLEGESRWL
jgi:hypothetical protein